MHCPERCFLRALRRCTGWIFDLKHMQGVSIGASRVCTGRSVRNIPGQVAGRDSLVEIRQDASGGAGSGADAGRGDSSARRRRSQRHACDSRSIAPQKNCTARFQPGAPAGAPGGGGCQDKSPELEPETGCGGYVEVAGHRDPGQFDAPPAPIESARCIRRDRSLRGSSQACVADRRHFDYGRNGSRCRDGADEGRSRIGLGGYAGQGTPGPPVPEHPMGRRGNCSELSDSRSGHSRNRWKP